MTSLCATGCTRPSPDGRLCKTCGRELGLALITAATISGDLDDATARLLRLGATGRGPAKAESPLPIDLGASDAATALRGALAAWALTLTPPATIHDPSIATIRGMALWLMRHFGELRQHDQAGTAHRQITAAVRGALAVVDRRPERIGAGTCHDCSAQLWTDTGADTVVCDCGALNSAIAGRRAAAAAKADLLGSATGISEALAAVGHRVSASTIRAWATRGRLQQRPGALYRLSEVLGLVAERDARAS